MRGGSALDTHARGHRPTTRHATLGEPRGFHARIGTLFNALRQWWTFGRHYRPEQRYMRGRPLTTRP
jgi:hypothetical protein